MQDKVDRQAPQRWPDHQPLRQRQPIVHLPQYDPRNDVADGCERQELCPQQHEAHDYLRIKSHSSDLRSGARSQDM